MGMSLLSALALLAAPADGRTVVPVEGALPSSELSCLGALEGARLAPAATGLGVRAPLAAATVPCKLTQADGTQSDVSLAFAAPGEGLFVAAGKLPVLGQESEVLLSASSKVVRAAGSAGEATIVDGQIKAPLPTLKMPQNLVVLAAGPEGVGYTVVPLLGRAKVGIKTRSSSQLETVVAGTRLGGFQSDGKGKADLAIPAPPGFVQGLLRVTDSKGKSSTADLELPAAKPLFALAVLAPIGAVPPGSTFTVVAAGANPAGLPPADSELGVVASGGTTVQPAKLLAPGLWELSVTAPQSGAADVKLTLGQATFPVSLPVESGAKAPLLIPIEPTRIELAFEAKQLASGQSVPLTAKLVDAKGRVADAALTVNVTGPGSWKAGESGPGRTGGDLSVPAGSKPGSSVTVEVSGAGFKESRTVEVIAGKPASLVLGVPEADPVDPLALRVAADVKDAEGNAIAPKLVARNGHVESLEGNRFRVTGTPGTLVTLSTGEGPEAQVQLPSAGEKGPRVLVGIQAGYLTNGGSIAGFAPGAALIGAWGLGSFDLGVGADVLVASTTQAGNVSFQGGSLATSTTTQTLQLLAGPWARYRFTDHLGVAATGGVGLSRVTQSISAQGGVNSAGASNTLAFGGAAGLDLRFGLFRAFAGARYAASTASGELSGNAGGIAGVASVGIDLPL